MEVFQGWGPLKEFPRLLGKKKRKRQILWCAVVSRCFTVSFGRYFNGASASSADQGRGSLYWMKRERIWILALLFTILQMFMQPAPEQWATSILPSHPAQQEAGGERALCSCTCSLPRPHLPSFICWGPMAHRASFSYMGS